MNFESLTDHKFFKSQSEFGILIHNKRLNANKVGGNRYIQTGEDITCVIGTTYTYFESNENWVQKELIGNGTLFK